MAIHVKYTIFLVISQSRKVVFCMKGGTRKRGKTWSYYFDMGTVGGKRQKKEKGGFSTKKEAEAALAAALNEYNNAGMIFTPSEITVSDFLDLWYDQYVKMHCKYATQRNYDSVIRTHLKPQFGNYKLKSMTTASIQEYVNTMKKEGFARQTIREALVILVTSLNYAVEPLNYIQYNPAERVKIPKYGQKKTPVHHFIPESDMKRIIERFPESSPFYVPIMIGYYTGVRISECFALTWDRIDLKNQVIRIDRQVVYKCEMGWFFQSPKTESSIRSIQYGATLQKILLAAHKRKLKQRMELGSRFIEYYIQPGNDEKGNTAYKIMSCERGNMPDMDVADFVCVRDSGKVISPYSFSHVASVCRKELKIDFNYHSLRHTHATMLIQAGAPIKDVQERLGHSSIQTTMNAYVHDTDSMKNETVEIFEQISHLA